MKCTSYVCAEVARIEGEMRTILDANGFSGNQSEKHGPSWQRPTFLFPNNDKGRADALAEYTR